MAKWFKSYRFRFKFTIDADLIDAALTDFPVALSIKAASGTGAADLTKVFDVAGANWTNLAVCGADGETPLWTEVETWDAANESGVLHVRVPKISASADTDLYLYFDADGLGNGYIGATGSTAAQSVWDANFVSVWHMATDPSGASAFRDSTANALHGTMVGTMLTEDLVAGQIGKAIDFDGSNDEFTVADNALHNIGAAEDWTCEAVVNKDEGSVRACIFDKRYAGANTGWFLGIHEDDVPHFSLNDGSDSVEPAGSTAMTVNGTTWYHVAGVFDRTGANTAAVYLNGGIDCAPVNATAIGDCTRSYPLHVGDQGYAGSSWGSFNGKMSELRLSDTVRSAAWLKATYNTLFDSLGAWAAVEAISAAPTGSWLGTWQHRLALTVATDNIDADLTDFPLAVFLSAAAGIGDVDVSAVFDELGANSHKIAVTDHTGIRQLFVEVDTWDNSNESAVLHAKVPHLDGDTSTLLYLYYDANQADNDGFVGDPGDAVAMNVWDDDFDAVWHMNGDPSAASGIKNSKVDSNHLSGVNMESGDCAASSVIGKHVDLDGSNEYLVTALSGLPTVNAVKTVEMVYNTDGTARLGCGSRVNYGGVDNSAKGWVLSLDNSGNQRRVYHTGDGEYGYGTGPTIDVDYYTAFTCGVNGATPALYVGSAAITPATTTLAAGTAENTSGYFAIGWETGTNYTNGQISEVRLSSAVRSAAWLKATYYTLFDGISAWAAAAETFAGIGWLRGFTKRTKIAVAATNIDAALTHFPLTLFLSSSCGTGSQDMTPVFDEIGANSKKIAITAADGKTQLPVEIDYWDSTGETAVLHVRVPSVDSAAATALYLYYSADVPDNDEFVGATGEAPGMSVWDQYFAGVWHLSTDPSGTAPQGLDSTVNGLHGTSAGTMTSADLVAGVIGKGTDFDGADDYYDIADCAVLDAITFPNTVEAIFKVAGDWVPSNQDYTGILFKGYTATSIGLRIYERDADSTTRIEFGGTYDVIANDFANGAWKYVAGVAHLTANDQIFIDGVEVGTYSSQAKTVFAATNYSLRIGDIYPNSADFVNFPGIISEARLSSTDRSAAWVKATYYSMYDGLVSYTVDIESEDNWLGDWANRIQIRIDSTKIDANLTDFPVAIVLSSAAGINGADLTAIFDELGANNLKLAVATAAGAQCYVEIDTWDETGETAVLHTKIPTVYAGRDTIFYLYYDADKADNSTYVGVTGSAAAQGVWDANFLGVYHFSQDLSASDLLDSTANGYDGTPANFEAGDTVAGQVGKHVTPDGSAETVTGFDAGIVVTGTGQRTTEILAYPDQSGIAFPVYLGGSGTRDAWGLMYSPTEISAALSGCRRGITGTYGNTLRHVAISYPSGQTSSNQVALVVDGVAQSVSLTSGADGTINTATTYRRFFQIHTGDCAANVTDEVRISNVQRTTAWLKATYNTLFDTLLSHGATETLGGGWLRGWQYRRAFTIPSTNIDANLTDFPLALILNTSAGTGDADISTIFDEIDENSKRIAVCTAHGDKQVPVEIDVWDGASEAAVLHAKAPLVTAADGAVVYVYYDDDRYDNGFIGETGEAIAQRVWDDDFTAVYHFNVQPAGAADELTEATVNGYDFSGNNFDGDEQSGSWIAFNGTDEYFSRAYTAALDPEGKTYISWEALIDYATGEDCFIWTNAYSSDNFCGFYIDNADSKLVFFLYMYSGSPKNQRKWVTDAAITTGIHHVMAVHTDSGGCTIYVDGASVATTVALTDGNDVITTTNSTHYIGRRYNGTPYQDSELGEIRISNGIIRPAAYAKATYNTLFDSLAAWGAEGEEPGDEPVTLDEPLNKAGRIDFTPHAIADVLSMTEALSKAGRIDFTAHSLTESYVGNLLKMTAAAGARPKILTATGTKPGIANASGARPRLAAAEAYEYQERE